MFGPKNSAAGRNWLARMRYSLCSEALTSPASTEAGTSSASLEFGGRTRSYRVHVPPGYDAKTPLPLVFVLHGGTQSAESAERCPG